jgi:hypothetical protein
LRLLEQRHLDVRLPAKRYGKAEPRSVAGSYS